MKGTCAGKRGRGGRIVEKKTAEENGLGKRRKKKPYKKAAQENNRIKR